MFEQSILRSATKTRRAWTVMVSFASQTILIGIGILMPMVVFDRLPQARLTPPLLAPPPPPPGPSASLKKHSVQVVDVKWQYRKGQLIAFRSMPPRAAQVTDPPDLEQETGPVCVGCPIGGVGPRGGTQGVPFGLGLAEPPPPPPPPPRREQKPVEKPPDPVRIGGQVMMAKLVRQVTPVYPPLARQARVTGTVQLQAVIGRDGRIQDLQVVGGHPLLIAAAVEAVRQWVYQPTTLNGTPVEVLTTIDVIFTLSR
ncbi:MAG: energy transducer TonB [Bryobacteraceae bacterium]|jgi:protein TonB